MQSTLSLLCVCVLEGVCYDYAQTSVISSLVRFCLGCSSSGAYINSFLEKNNEVRVNKIKVKDVVGQKKRNREIYGDSKSKQVVK